MKKIIKAITNLIEFFKSKSHPIHIILRNSDNVIINITVNDDVEKKH